MILEMFLSIGVIIALIVGMIFTFVAALGLLKLDNAMSRLHAPTKAGTVGIGAFLLAAILNSFLIGEGTVHGMLIMGFLFVTAPISANFMAKVNIHQKASKAPPPPLRDDTWATLNVPKADLIVAQSQPKT